LSGGAAELAVSNLAVGSHSVSAAYGGADGYAASASPAVNVTITAALPAAPSNLTAAAVSMSEIDLSWAASSTTGVTYNVYASAVSGFTPAAGNRIATGVTGTSYANNGLAPSTARYYAVTAQNVNGESAASNQASATTQSGVACKVGYSLTTQWNGGFQTSIAIKNTGSLPVNGWHLTWTWAGDQQITGAWDSTYVQSGKNATLTNESWNASIAVGATISGIGFNANYSGSNPAPTAFYLNGTRCQ
jgi:mannan endo-1,4-beta-mannosidase